jgi:hypothetical protein
MLRKKILNIKQNSPKISLPLIIPSLSNKFKTINNKNNSMNFLEQMPKTIDTRKIRIRKINLNKSLLNDIEVVKNLDIDVIPNMLMARQFEMKKLKENIDNNTDIELKRLGKYKQKQSKQSNQSTDEKDIESKERVKILEKKYLEFLDQYKNNKSELEKINAHILNIINIIDDYKLELYSFDNYSNDIYKKFKENIEKKKLELMTKMENMQYQSMDEYNLFEKELNKLTGDKFHFQEEIKQKRIIINENITKAEELLNKLQEKKNDINNTTKELKNNIKENKINLIKLYHLSLYEGLDFRYEGLSNIIRSIWNLGVEVDVAFMPKYLDKLLINFLFEHAKLVIQINNFKKQLDLSNKKFLNDLDDWKKTNNISNNITLRHDETSQRSSNNISDVDLFQTKLNKSKLGNKNRNSKSMKFMQNYYNKFYFLIDNKEKNELNDYKQSRLQYNFSIPKKFVEEHQDIEKGKIILQNLQNKMKNMEKNEIKRICREFTYNNYGIIYNVCPYIIVSAICGNESKDEGMIFYNMTEREISDNKKKLRFHDVNKNIINI